MLKPLARDGRRVELSLALPQHWTQLPLDDPESLRRTVAEWVGHASDLARFREQVYQDVRVLLEQAADRQVLAAAWMSLALEGDVVGATLLVTRWRAGCPNLRAVADRRQAAVLNLPRVGSTLRLRQLVSVAAPHGSNAVPLLRVQYAVPVEADVCVLLTFTSPSLAYEPALLEMFDMITSSLSVPPAITA